MARDRSEHTHPLLKPMLPPRRAFQIPVMVAHEKAAFMLVTCLFVCRLHLTPTLSHDIAVLCVCWVAADQRGLRLLLYIVAVHCVCWLTAVDIACVCCQTMLLCIVSAVLQRPAILVSADWQDHSREQDT